MITSKQLVNFIETKIYNYVESRNIKLYRDDIGNGIIKFKTITNIKLRLDNINSETTINRVKKIKVSDNNISFINNSNNTICDIDYMDNIYVELYTHMYFDSTYILNLKTKNNNELRSNIDIINQLYPKFRYDIHKDIVNDDIKYICNIYVKPSITGDEFKLLSNGYNSEDRCILDTIKISEQMKSSKSLKDLLDSLDKNNGIFMIYNGIKYEIIKYVTNYIIVADDSDRTNSIHIQDFIEEKNVLIYDNNKVIYNREGFYYKNNNITTSIPEKLSIDLQVLDNSLIYSILMSYPYIKMQYKIINDPSDLNDIIQIMLNKIYQLLEYKIFNNEILNDKTLLILLNDNTTLQISNEIIDSIKKELTTIKYIINQPLEFVGEEFDEELDNIKVIGHTVANIDRGPNFISECNN